MLTLFLELTIIATEKLKIRRAYRKSQTLLRTVPSRTHTGLPFP